MTFVKTDIKDYENLSDNEVIDLIMNRGRKDLLEVVYDRYVNKVYYKVITLINDRELAKDVTHDVLVKIILNLSKFKKEGPFSIWVNSITYNFCMDYFRKKKRLKMDAPGDDFFNSVPDDDTELKLKQVKELRFEQLEQMVMKLNDEERILMLMRYNDNFPVLKIAEVLGIKEGAVKMRLKRCRAKLAKLINDGHYAK